MVNHGQLRKAFPNSCRQFFSCNFPLWKMHHKYACCFPKLIWRELFFFFQSLEILIFRVALLHYSKHYKTGSYQKVLICILQALLINLCMHLCFSYEFLNFNSSWFLWFWIHCFLYWEMLSFLVASLTLSHAHVCFPPYVCVCLKQVEDSCASSSNIHKKSVIC